MEIKNNLRKGGIELRSYRPNVTEKEYYISPPLGKDLEGIIATIRGIKNFGTEMGDRNFIFIGPAGTGKTLGVQYIATVLGLPVFDGKSIMSAQTVSAAYAKLREFARNQHLILLINELDKFCSRDDVVDPTQQLTLNQLLDEMDGTESNHGIYVFATTNKPNKVEPALRRPKRFSKEVYFMPPDRDGRLAILEMHADGRGGHKFKVKKKLLEDAADVTYGYTGADLVGLLNEAFTHANLNGRLKVTQPDFEYALMKTKPSAIRDMPFREPKIKFNDVGGYDDHKNLIRRVIGNSKGSVMLFYGPRGTGKTSFAEAIAGEYGFNLIVISGSEPKDKFVGETGKIIDRYIERAKQLAPCILVFDEIVSLIEKKGLISHEGTWTGLLQSRLSHPIEGVYIIGTAVRPDLLVDTFIDRFVHKLYFGLPTPEEQVAIWNVYLPDDVDARRLVEANNQLSGRDIERAHTLITDYGLEPSEGSYLHLIQNIGRKQEPLHEEIRDSIGDSVDDFRKVKPLMVR